MPSWGIHLKVANILADKIKNINKNLFVLANILPDINNGHVIKKIDKIISHSVTHFSGRVDYKNYKTFYEKYCDFIENEVVLGYYTHLLTDYFFNNLTYTKRGVFDEDGKPIGVKLNSGEKKICEEEEVRKIKTNDFKIFSSYIYENDKLPEIKYNEDVLLVNDIINEIKISEGDVLNTIKYLNCHISGNIKVFQEGEEKIYSIFTQEEMKNYLQPCVEFIIEKLNNIMIKNA